MKRCRTCDTFRSLSSFNKRSTSKDGLQDRCRICSKKWYEENKKAHKANSKKNSKSRRESLRRQMLEFLKGKKCSDCGEQDIITFEFDHVRGNKEADVSTLLADGCRWSRVLNEIKKCEIVCANCHRKRSAKKYGSYRLAPVA